MQAAQDYCNRKTKDRRKYIIHNFWKFLKWSNIFFTNQSAYIMELSPSSIYNRREMPFFLWELKAHYLIQRTPTESYGESVYPVQTVTFCLFHFNITLSSRSNSFQVSSSFRLFRLTLYIYIILYWSKYYLFLNSEHEVTHSVDNMTL